MDAVHNLEVTLSQSCFAAGKVAIGLAGFAKSALDPYA